MSMLIAPSRFGVAPVGSLFTSRYWRLYITATEDDGNYINCCLIGLNTNQASLTNLAAAIGGSSTQSSSLQANLESIKAWANPNEDGTRINSTDYWHSSSQSAPWWTIFDCGEGKQISAGTLVLCGTNIATRMPKDFHLQISDDAVTWTDVLIVIGVTGWTSGEPKFFDMHQPTQVQPMPIVNGAGSDVSGWTNLTGTLLTRSGYFYSQVATLRAYQEFAVPADMQAAVLAGEGYVKVSWQAGGYPGDSDSGEMEIVALDSSDAILSTQGTGLLDLGVDPSAATAQTYTVLLPAGTTSVRVQMHGVRHVGTDNNAYFAQISAEFAW